MKLDVILSYVLSILEGGLAGACFYRAGKAEEKKPKALLYLTGALWFALSLLDGVKGARAWKDAKTTEINGGNDND